MDVGGSEKLTNLRFADDLLLIGRSCQQAQRMLTEVAKYSLEVHPDKTKVMWNGIGRGTKSTYITIGSTLFEVFPPSATTDYLGRSFSFTDTYDVELRSRINKAWRKFALFRNELTDKAYPVHQRLKLF